MDGLADVKATLMFASRHSQSQPVFARPALICAFAAEQFTNYSLVDPGERPNVVDRRAFSDLVHGRVGQPEVDDRT
jgi:hypothetical protein